MKSTKSLIINVNKLLTVLINVNKSLLISFYQRVSIMNANTLLEVLINDDESLIIGSNHQVCVALPGNKLVNHINNLSDCKRVSVHNLASLESLFYDL